MYTVTSKKTKTVADGSCWIDITVTGDELQETWDDRVSEAEYDADYEAVIAPLIKRRIEIRQQEAEQAVQSATVEIAEVNQEEKTSDKSKIEAKNEELAEVGEIAIP